MVIVKRKTSLDLLATIQLLGAIDASRRAYFGTISTLASAL